MLIPISADIATLLHQECIYHSVVLLTQWDRVTHICVGKLTTIGSDNLHQCWNFVNCAFRNKFHWNFHRSSNIFGHENVLKNGVWEMAYILPRSQCVNIFHLLFYKGIYFINGIDPVLLLGCWTAFHTMWGFTVFSISCVSCFITSVIRADYVQFVWLQLKSILSHSPYYLMLLMFFLLLGFPFIQFAFKCIVEFGFNWRPECTPLCTKSLKYSCFHQENTLSPTKNKTCTTSHNWNLSYMNLFTYCNLQFF